MTVAEFIEKLKGLPQDLEVVACDSEQGFGPPIAEVVERRVYGMPPFVQVQIWPGDE